jgi:hypothetical protein
MSEAPRQQSGGAMIALALALVAASSDEELSYEGLKRRLRSELSRDPIDAVLGFTASVAWLFYQAERYENPKVTSYYDALMYVSTSLSVGYHDVFPRTPAGKIIAAVVHALGPAMATSTLEAPAGAEDKDSAIVSRLDAVLEELRALRLATPASVR